jgi:histidinol dehydrogenase
MRPQGVETGMGAIGPVEDHRRREEGALVYPVYSRRSRGLSVGINLFPDRRVCSFDCPYCEVFPFQAAAAFSLARLEAALPPVLAGAKERGLPVRDLCFSGSGEPTMAPAFPAALESAARIRNTLAPEAALVLITNGTGLLKAETFDFLRYAAQPAQPVKGCYPNDAAGAGAQKIPQYAKQAGRLQADRRAAEAWDLHIWLKLDAGTEDWYHHINRGAVPFEKLMEKIRDFVRAAPVIIQTMICSIHGRPPPDAEAAAWERLALELAAAGTAPAPSLPAAVSAAVPAPGKNAAPGTAAPGVRAFQIYGKARPAPDDPLAEALPPAFLEARAASLRAALSAAGVRAPGGAEIPVEVFP